MEVSNTHANRCYTSVILENVSSVDRSSSYPDCLVNFPYPVKPFIKQNITRIEELEEGFPYLIEIEFYNIKQRDPFNGCPYLAVHKCYNLTGSINDNGRVLSAKFLQTNLTDLDLQIVLSQYEFTDAKITKCYRSEYGLLPPGVTDTIMKYYKLKTELKNVEGSETYYLKAKQKLNSCYGMMATNPVRTTLKFNGVDFSVEEVNEEEELKKANKKSFVCYVWGCYCTAYARLELQKAIDLCGHKFVYCDTDSVKYIGDVDFSGINKVIQERSEKHGAFADDPAGQRHYLGVFEKEGKGKYTYSRFVTLGAKKYAYEDEKGKLHITLAGVSKEGADELQKLENFKEGFIFRNSAGMEAVYNDLPHDPVIIEGHVVEIPPNIYLHKSEYTLGLTVDYKKLFHLTQEDFDKIMKLR